MNAYDEMKARWAVEEAELEARMKAMKKAHFEEAKERAVKARKDWEPIYAQLKIQKNQLAELRKANQGNLTSESESEAIIKCEEILADLEMEEKKKSHEMIAFEGFFSAWNMYPPR
ncbi:MAG: hypothetical protein Terrestrivirus1_284 [Terrestrivirus sp.]|uniref:Uncharacterized protein n=1 Tax=Terrestrivirus sp. TaxID=2487775 RepID=A0A3G4ZKQ1_9VIRU|nr:MAG: hypothetical protein Terrestrivirus1_284 [Terrestrivirus sp.]